MVIHLAIRHLFVFIGPKGKQTNKKTHALLISLKTFQSFPCVQGVSSVVQKNSSNQPFSPATEDRSFRVACCLLPVTALRLERYVDGKEHSLLFASCACRWMEVLVLEAEDLKTYRPRFGTEAMW